MVQTDEKILPYNEKKNLAFIVKYTRKSVTMKSSITTHSVGEGRGKTSVNMVRKSYWSECYVRRQCQRNGMLRRVVDDPVGEHYILCAGNRIDLSRRSQQISFTWICLQVVSRFTCT
jgi:hypothetical protein